VHHKTIICLLPGVRRQNGTKKFSVDDEKYWSTAVASAVGSLFHAPLCGDRESRVADSSTFTCMTRSPDDEAHSAYRAGTSAASVVFSAVAETRNVMCGQSVTAELVIDTVPWNCIK